MRIIVILQVVMRVCPLLQSTLQLKGWTWMLWRILRPYHLGSLYQRCLYVYSCCFALLHCRRYPAALCPHLWCLYPCMNGLSLCLSHWVLFGMTRNNGLAPKFAAGVPERLDDLLESWSRWVQRSSEKQTMISAACLPIRLQYVCPQSGQQDGSLHFQFWSQISTWLSQSFQMIVY